MMQFQDLEVLKDIPGYKPILKAVLKSQIQMLVEQLASHTEEESVLLTASVTDGSLCHLGSDSGKTFLEGHEEIKSQFLGHCLKRHQKRKADEAEAEAAAKRRQSLPAPQHVQHSTRPRQFNFQKRARSMGGSNTPRFGSPRPPNPVLLSKSSLKKMTGQSLPHSFPSSIQTPVINTSITNVPTSVHETLTCGDSDGFQQMEKETLIVKVEDQSGNIDSQHSENSQTADSEMKQSIDNQSSGLVPGPTGIGSSEANNDSALSSVKLEPIDEGDIDDLEITGVELANMAEGSQMSTDWSQNYGASTSTAGEEYGEGAQSMDNLPSTATGYTEMSNKFIQQPPNLYLFNPAIGQLPTPTPDISFQQHRVESLPAAVEAIPTPLLTSTYVPTPVSLCTQVGDKWSCVLCRRLFNRKDYVMKHVLIHTGEKPFTCHVCHKQFRHWSNLRVHIGTIHAGVLMK